jgi:general secretion pathway protein I
MSRRGFTLLEMLVATTIMGIAVVGLLSNLSTSLNNAARLTGHDRAAVLAREKMDELLLDPRLPESVFVEGTFDPSQTGGAEAGWRARLTPFEVPPDAARGAPILERIELEVWWRTGLGQRTLSLDGYRRGLLADGPPGQQGQ